VTVQDFQTKANEYRVLAGQGKYHSPTEVCKVLEEIVEKIEGISDHEREQLNNDCYDVGMLFWSF